MSTAAELPWAVVGPYRLVRLLGRGGMAEVYLACDPTTGGPVAVKVIAEALCADPAARRRFLREARLLAGITHPRVVAVRSCGELRGRLYLVMDYVDGETLRQVLDRRTRLPAGEAVRTAREVVEALAAGWEHGIVHRDVKPSNILLDPRTGARLADFGLAKAIGAAGLTTLTAAGEFVGTPHYVAPEQALGRAGGIDLRTDFYSLGVVLYEMLAGRPPFDAEAPVEVVRMQVRQSPPPLRERCPELPAELVRLVERLLAKDPDRRPGNHDELLAEMAAVGCLPSGAGNRRDRSVPEI